MEIVGHPVLADHLSQSGPADIAHRLGARVIEQHWDIGEEVDEPRQEHEEDAESHHDLEREFPLRREGERALLPVFRKESDQGGGDREYAGYQQKPAGDVKNAKAVKKARLLVRMPAKNADDHDRYTEVRQAMAQSKRRRASRYMKRTDPTPARAPKNRQPKELSPKKSMPPAMKSLESGGCVFSCP